ncbi:MULTISPECIES: hypothetical protein [unclassified Nodularia (in: cyanobacteria)]|uniref:hypothetical protein n=1 Tax=unclassified Nodularia (in: cyanobacteria) TaxID=2656917 RepID=UPI00188244CA|nr:MULTISPECIES: hypothetical protein [unclassified Nodularia (in: cyanobacteria)]MBE9201111.1 hypothetical protein [Nodularia sp. LEGE 06071]MCC2694818.1 hypothetical protein [Nodularia sp. LEGE 04288]
MKIIQENDSQMTLRLRPWLLWIFGVILTNIGLSGAVLWPKVHTFTCRRDTTAPAICQSYTTGLSSSDQQVVSLKDIQGTKIHTVKGSKGKRSYRLLLLTNKGEISPISIDISDQRTVKNWVEEIEVFRKDTQKQNLLIEYDNRFSDYLFAGLFTSLGLVLGLVLGKVFVCKIDKSLGKLTLEQYGLLGNSQAEYSTSQIRGVTVQKTKSSKGSRTYRIALFMYSGEYIPFTSYYTSGFRYHQQIADRISEFLDLEPMRENDDMMSFKKVFSTVQEISKMVFMTRQKREAELPSLQQAVMNNRNDAEANFQYGLSLYILERYQEAQPFLEEAKRLFVLSGQYQRVDKIDGFLQSLNRKL